jgi:uncharacterized membrane protein
VLYGLIGSKAHRKISPILFFIFMNYAGLGFFKIEEFSVANDEVFWNKIGSLALYVLFLQWCFSRISDDNRLTSWTLALASVALQLGLAVLYPTLEGYSGFLAFGFLLGRVLGVYHPPTEDREPLNRARQVVGWVALLIFVLCFSPKPFIVL